MKAMCLAVPLEVVDVKDNLATVSFGNTTREVYLDLMDTVAVGDFIIVHAGFAIEKLDKEEAAKTLALFKEVMDEIS
jgi:hydrogenase expression/formation protein HypC